MKKDLVSIIVPVYNTEKYIRECLDNLVNQTYKNIEVILIDDGSTDNSSLICDEYCKKDERFKVYHRTNHGLALTRNFGVSKSSGEYIMFCDSDDYYDVTMVEKMHDIISKNNVDIARCTLNSDLVKDDMSDICDKVITIDKDLISRFLVRKKNIGCYLALLIMKKEFIRDIEESLSYLEDTYFVVNLFLNAKTCYFTDEKLYTYRPNPTSITKEPKNALRNIDSALNCYKLLDEILKEKGINDKDFFIDKNTLLVELIYYKLDLITKDYFKNNKDKIYSTLRNKYLIYVFKESDSKKLFLQARIARFLINNKMYNLVFRFIWSKDFIKRLIKK